MCLNLDWGLHWGLHEVFQRGGELVNNHTLTPPRSKTKPGLTQNRVVERRKASSHMGPNGFRFPFEID